MNSIGNCNHYLQLSSELFCSIKRNGMVFQAIGPWYEKLGYTLEQINGSSIFSHLFAEDVSLFNENLASPKDLCIRINNSQGEAIWFEVKISDFNEEGVFFMRALDVSGRIRRDLKNTEQTNSLLLEIESIKQRLEIAARAVKFGVWDWNLKTGKLIWDSYMYELYEINQQDFTSDYDAFEKILVEEDRLKVQGNINTIVEARDPEFKTEFRIKTKNGKIRFIKAIGSCFYDKEGKIDRIVGNNWDVTENRETEERLKEARFEIEKFFSISLDPLCVAREGLFKRVNQAFADTLEYTVEELTSQPFINFVHPDDVMATRKEIENLAQGIPTLRFENRYRTKSGSYRYFSWVAAPDPETGLLYCAVRDMTDQIKSQQKAVQSAQMATLGEMAGGVAHEINNPLAIVQGKARQIDRAIQNEKIDVEKIRTDLQKIISTTNRIVKIVKGLRSFSRDSSKDPVESVSVRTIVEEVLDLSSERFRNHEIDLKVNITTDIEIECRSPQIGQILMNLLNNAHDAVVELSIKWVAVDVLAKNDRVIIEVTDSGTGIPHSIVEKMMQPFYTTKEVGKGIGLGLSISRGIAEEHKGTLRYDPLSNYTRFALELPVKQQAAASSGQNKISY